MPPCVPGPSGLSAFTLCLRPALPRRQLAPAALQPLVQTANMSREEKKRVRKQEPYRWAKIQSRKAEKVGRQNELKEERKAAWGSPIHGIPSPFVESFDSAGQAKMSPQILGRNNVVLAEPHRLPTSPSILNHGLSKDEVNAAIQMAYRLSKPPKAKNRNTVDAVTEAQNDKLHKEHHRKALLAMERITSLEYGNGRDRLHANIRRCIDRLGRHNTDRVLQPKPRAPGFPPREVLKRGGPDTGSSEVQIAILTAKIRTLAKIFEGPYGHKDKANRRSLRLLCHRRQKLLKYMERKERGSERWTNMLKTLGLTPATWKGQISI